MQTNLSRLTMALMAMMALPTTSEAQNDSLRQATLNPVVVTGTGTYRKAENAPVAVRVISQKELRDAHVVSLQEALGKLTSNITTQTNGMGTFVCFNGVSDDYILILENGKRLSGDDRWDRISIDHVKRIEILSGAASALYGSDAIAGVVNIITDNTKDPFEATASITMMSKNRLTQRVKVDATAGAFTTHTTYQHREADNWQVNHYQEFKEGEQSAYRLTGRPMAQGFRSDQFSERLEWRMSTALDGYANANYYDYRTLRDRNATYFTQKTTTDKTTGEKTYTYTPKQAYSYDIHHVTYSIGGGLRWVPDNKTHLYLDVYTDNFKSDYDHWQTDGEEAYDETRKHTRYYNETLKGIFRLNSWNKLSGGIEMEQNHLESASDHIDGEHDYSHHLFAQDEMTLCGGLEAVLGLRYTYNRNFGSHLTPNVALFYRLGQFRFRLSYAEGYRTPTLSQRYATDQAKTSARYTVNNPNLKPECNRFWNANVGYAGKWASVEVTGFVNRIRDMINYRTLSQTEIDGNPQLAALYEEGWTTIRQRDNIDEATVKGVTVSGKLFLPYGFSLSAHYTYGHSRARNQTYDAKTQTTKTIESAVDKSVRHVGNVAAGWEHQWNDYSLHVELNGHLQGQRYSSTYGYAPKYQQWDLHTRHTIRLRQLLLMPGIGIDNLFNKRDCSYWNSNFSTINPGRSLVVSVTLKFKD